MNTYYEISGLAVKANKIETIIDTIFEADWNVIKQLNNRHIVRKNNGVETLIISIKCNFAEKEIKLKNVKKKYEVL